MRKFVGLIVALIALGAASAQAAVVYSQPYNTVQGLDSVYTSDAGNLYILVDDFILDTDCLITDVHWWGVYLYSETPPEDNFTIDFLPYNAGPVLPPFASENVGDVGRTDTGDVWTNPFGGETFAIYRYSCDLTTPLALAGGTTYCISIYNNTPYGEWALSYADSLSGNIWYHNAPGSPDFQPSRPDFAFELTGESGPIIPEPVTALLFGGSVLAGLGRLRRRLS